MQLERVTPDNFSELWPQIKPMLESACERSRGRFSVDTSVSLMARGLWQFWVGRNDETVVVFAATEIITFPTGLMVGNIIITTGRNRRVWKHLIDDLAVWFREQGCAEQQTLARKGWAKELPAFTLTHVLLERAI